MASAGLCDLRGPFSLGQVCPDTGTIPQPTTTHRITGACFRSLIPFGLVSSMEKESSGQQNTLQGTSALPTDQLKKAGF